MAVSHYNLDLIGLNIEELYAQAEAEVFSEKSFKSRLLDPSIVLYLESLSQNSERASAAFNNIVTGFAIKVTFPDLDVRYHQTGIQSQSSIGKTWFNHRGVSETIIYPWLNHHRFNGAKSGWQTRTLERPKPYILTYDEHIGHIKDEFLGVYEFIQKKSETDVRNALLYIIELQIKLRESKNITLATPNISNIELIIDHFSSHFYFSYRGKGASRLPVLALYAILQIVSSEMMRYSNWGLKSLKNHSAADSQTGSCGDIEFEDQKGKLVEGIEVKHNILIDENLVNDAITKISPFQLDRYYILTTHTNCKPNEKMIRLLSKAEQKIGCQIVVNGIIPTMRYYLRLVSKPQRIYENYTKLLESDEAVTHEHREVWNKIILN